MTERIEIESCLGALLRPEGFKDYGPNVLQVAGRREAAGADVFVTGEISEPQAHLACETGMAFLVCGHHASERYGAPAVAAFVAERFGLRHRFIEIECAA